eukprot:5083276-Prymnesium_polylepis.1
MSCPPTASGGCSRCTSPCSWPAVPHTHRPHLCQLPERLPIRTPRIAGRSPVTQLILGSQTGTREDAHSTWHVHLPLHVPSRGGWRV